jgi:hypothetical protein
LARHTLDAMGKDTDVRRLASGNAEAWRLARVWLRAEGTEALVVLGAEHLHAGAWSKAIALGREAPLALVLVHERVGLRRGHRELLASDDGPQEVGAEQFIRWLSAERHRPSGARELFGAPAHRRFPRVPDDEIPYFRDACRRALAPAGLREVEETAVKAIHATRRWLCRTERVTEASAAAFLVELTSSICDVNEELVLLRGAQAALWRAGWLLKVDASLLAAARGAEPDVPLEEARERLRHCPHPRDAALGAVAIAGRLGPKELAMLSVDQVSVSGERAALRLDREDAELGALSPVVRALLLERQASDPRPHDPLFTSASGERLRPKGIQRLLRRLALESGLPLLRVKPAAARDPSGWCARRGVVLQRL